MADPAFLSKPGKHEVKSVFQHLPGLGPSSLSPPMPFVSSKILLSNYEDTNCRAARTNLIIKIVSYLHYLPMKPFVMGCFGRLGAWKCLHGQSEGDLDGWMKTQPWALAWQYVSVPLEPHEVHQEHPRETRGQFSALHATLSPPQLHGALSGPPRAPGCFGARVAGGREL